MRPTWVGQSVDSSLALASFAIALVAVVLTPHPVRVSSAMFWTALFASIFAAAMFGTPLRRSASRRKAPRAVSPNPRLVADQCRAIAEALTALGIDPLQGRRLFIRPRSSGKHRAVTAVSRYRAGLRAWARNVFDDAVVCSAMPESARPLLEASSVEQLQRLRRCFEEAAGYIEAQREPVVPQ